MGTVDIKKLKGTNPIRRRQREIRILGILGILGILKLVYLFIWALGCYGFSHTLPWKRASSRTP